MNFVSVKKEIENIDYAWNKPKTYAIFVPVLSLIIQKIQCANTLPSIKVSFYHNEEKSRKFANMCNRHLIGSITQITASIIAIEIFSAPIFLLLTILAAYEMTDTLYKSLTNKRTTYIIDTNKGVIIETRTYLF